MKPITWRQLRREQEKARRRNKLKSIGAKSWTAIWTTAILLCSSAMIALTVFMWISE